MPYRGRTNVDWVYLRSDGLHLTIRADKAKHYLLVMIGVRLDCTRELNAQAEDIREPTGS